jgi:hypothetical protein
MNATEALRMAHEAGISVSLVGDFIRYQSHGPPPTRVLEALQAAKPEIVALLSRFSLGASGALAGNHLLYDLAQLGFSVRLCGDQASLDDESGQGRVPPIPLLYRFADNQSEYGLVLRALREPDADRDGCGDRFYLKQRGTPLIDMGSKREGQSALREAPPASRSGSTSTSPHHHSAPRHLDSLGTKVRPADSVG